MTRAGMKEYLDDIRNRYILGDHKEKSQILDEAEQVTNRHRKALIRALWTPPPPRAGSKIGRLKL